MTNSHTPASISNDVAMPTPQSAEAFGRIAAVVVCHNIGSRIHATLKPLFSQVEHIYLVDNNSDLETKEILKIIAAQHPGKLTLIERAENNLAAAQNMGINEALRQGFEWVLLLDHDSIADDAMINAFHTAFTSYPQPGKVAILAPRIIYANTTRHAAYPRMWKKIIPWRTHFLNRPYLDNVMDAVASGSLIPARVFRHMGTMDEGLVIDYIDKDFCLRAVKSGHQIVAVRDAVLHHRLGECHDHHIGRFRFTTTNHSAERRYYIYRNRVLCWIRHGIDVPAFLFYDLAATVYDLIRIFGFERQRPIKLRAIFTGTKDAILGVTGIGSAEQFSEKH